MIYGAILAGGIGKRIERYSLPKQFIQIGGVPIIVITIRTFLNNDRIDKLYIAVHNDWIVYCENLLKASFSKEQLARVRIVAGGKERLDSFANIMNDIIEKTGLHDDDILICHDSVRPFVTQQMINDTIDATMTDQLALTVTPVSDTIHTAYQEEEYISGTLDRNGLYNGQTPSGFNLKLLHDTLERCSEEDKKNVTGTTQLMLMNGHKIKKVKGHTQNFKITTDMDLDVADSIIRSTRKTGVAHLLDCTLRDGGIVINFDFGSENIQKIKSVLEDSGAEYIELGYIDQRKGSPSGRTCFDNEKAANAILETGKKAGVKYLAMIDYGTFDLENLSPAVESGIDGIRYAFHKENKDDALRCARTIIDKGYELYIQPMVTIRYSDEELREMIAYCNEHLAEAKAFYVVDSFGQMDNMMLQHKMEIADLYVSDSMRIGFHAHNNRQMAFSNALTWVNFPARHELMVDSSIMGMGKGAGNLCTELIMPILIAKGGNFNTVGIYELINDYIAAMQKTNPWGYSLDYYLSSLYGCTPSYIKIFTKDKRITTDALITLLRDMPNEKRAACDRTFAAAYLDQFLANL